jgi:integrase
LLEKGEPGDPVFRDAGGKRWEISALSHRFRMIVREAALAGRHGRLSPHALRHTAATWMRQANVPLDRIGEILGRKGLRNTLRYAHIQPIDLSDALNALGAASRARTEHETDAVDAPNLPLN